MPVAPGSPGLSPTDFSSAVTAITSAFGDPTRRRIYLLAHERAEGVTAAEVAEACALHPNVARHHLDKLVGAGHLEVSVARGGGSGRPSKRYRATAEQVELDVPVRHDEILLALLGAALTELGPARAEQVAEAVGEHYGRAMAGRMDDDAPRSARAALHAAADALTAHGFAAHAEDTRGELRIISEHCPFGDAAVEHPVICAVDRGMVRGLLATLTDADARAETEASLARGDQVCITSLSG
ncbi:helix-turn-helix domain-containing protein [Iamia sp. SCSIO 61187]|uniref:helix-turn-helix transcriptional regulator n=1 Tax=Iamia sp. SCSIO 61187 TaxID=2722752 RepID=UPI001C625BC4|nr:helix-turn-helix domain-containing protein [Iamia sp. SCSIO 61187]QYG91518.1 helix-turn-helix domain-containing protein [Iamia sp. SCSIO 61187]